MKDWYESSQRAGPPERWICDLLWGGNTYADKDFSTPGLEGRLLSVPAGQSPMGGDVHYITVCGGGILSKFLLLDVSGHGAAASEWSRYLHAPLHRLMEEQDNAAILGELNLRLLDAHTLGRFATAVAATYNSQTQRWIYAYAGHPYMLIRSEGTWQELPAKGERTVPVGIIDDTEYYQTEVGLSADEYILIFSDALIEIRQQTGQLLGLQGLVDTLNALPADGLQDLYPRLVAGLVAHNGGQHFNDDLTLVLLRHTGGPGPTTPPSG